MIDIKSLRIGCHVEYNGKRAMVYDISSEMNTPNHLIMLYQNNRFAAVPLAELSPITITPELLRELWFVNTSSSRRITYTKGSEYDGLWIEVRNLKDRWDVFVSNRDWDGRTVVRYLHELESFIYLTTQTELIQD